MLVTGLRQAYGEYNQISQERKQSLVVETPCKRRLLSQVQATLDASTVTADGNITLGSFRGGGAANQMFNGVGKAPDAWTANADNGRTGW